MDINAIGVYYCVNTNVGQHAKKDNKTYFDNSMNNAQTFFYTF